MKYFILADGCTLGIKYNTNNSLMSLGGYKRFNDVLESILLGIFNIEDFDKYKNMPQRNKIRYDIKMSMSEYYRYIDKFKDSDYVLRQTETLYRIFR